MDQGGIKVWIGMVWCSWPGGLLKMQSLLTLDSFSAHLVPAVCSRLQKEDTESCVIPWGLTSQLQPLDSVRHMFIPSGSLKKPDITTVCTWIKKNLGWNGIKHYHKNLPKVLHFQCIGWNWRPSHIWEWLWWWGSLISEHIWFREWRWKWNGSCMTVARKWHVPNDLLIIFLLVTLNYVKIRHLVPNSLVRLVPQCDLYRYLVKYSSHFSLLFLHPLLKSWNGSLLCTLKCTSILYDKGHWIYPWLWMNCKCSSLFTVVVKIFANQFSVWINFEHV